MTGRPMPDLCGHIAPQRRGDGYESCPLERDHDGPHLIWAQRAYTGGVRVSVWATDGEPQLAATFEGEVTAEEVCALVAIMEAARKAASE